MYLCVGMCFGRYSYYIKLFFFFPEIRLLAHNIRSLAACLGECLRLKYASCRLLPLLIYNPGNGFIARSTDVAFRECDV